MTAFSQDRPRGRDFLYDPKYVQYCTDCGCMFHRSFSDCPMCGKSNLSAMEKFFIDLIPWMFAICALIFYRFACWGIPALVGLIVFLWKKGW